MYNTNNKQIDLQNFSQYQNQNPMNFGTLINL